MEETGLRGISPWGMCATPSACRYTQEAPSISLVRTALPWDVQQLLTPLQAFLCSLGFAWASAPNENLLGLQGFRGFPYTVKIKGEVKDAAEAQVRTGTRSGSGHWPPWFWALNHSVCL